MKRFCILALLILIGHPMRTHGTVGPRYKPNYDHQGQELALLAVDGVLLTVNSHKAKSGGSFLWGSLGILAGAVSALGSTAPETRYAKGLVVLGAATAVAGMISIKVAMDERDSPSTQGKKLEVIPDVRNRGANVAISFHF